MTIPYSFIEAQQARGEEMREKSLANYARFRDLPQGESQLERLARRLRSLTSRVAEIRPRAVVSESVDTHGRTAFSK